MADPTGRYTSTWDALDRRGSVNWPNKGRITYTWDAVGNRVGMVDPDGGVTTYQYDDADRITLLNNPQSERTSYAYDAASRRTVKRLANGTRASFTYDAANQITLLSNLKSDQSVISSFDYEYDPAGNRTRVVEANGDRVTWSYDDDDQLTAEYRSGANAYAQTYTYDPAGNRTLKVIDGARTTYVYDVANQLGTAEAAAGGTTYTFDANGNQRVVQEPTGDRTTTTWDFENQPRLYRLPDASRATMAYNAGNRRTEKVDANGTTKHLWDEEIDAILMESNENNATTAVYTAEPTHYGRIVSQRKDAATETLHFDVLGSTREITDQGENVVGTNMYDAWGVNRVSIGTAETPFEWIGELGYHSDIGASIYIRARIYTSQLARWTTYDPEWRHIDHSRFCYGNNNPTVLIDPSGEAPEEVPLRDSPLDYICGGTKEGVPTPAKYLNDVPIGVNLRDEFCERVWDDGWCPEKGNMLNTTVPSFKQSWPLVIMYGWNPSRRNPRNGFLGVCEKVLVKQSTTHLITRGVVSESTICVCNGVRTCQYTVTNLAIYRLVSTIEWSVLSEYTMRFERNCKNLAKKLGTNDGAGPVRPAIDGLCKKYRTDDDFRKKVNQIVTTTPRYP
jgi:RHS repeat-associated protein